ncbi:MAG: hypothetical protein RJA13_1070 [Bacteroidota bacterium]|jgi:iron complex outermembrane receptor protein
MKIKLSVILLLSILFVGQSVAQNGKVEGTINTSQGVAIPFATVKVENQSIIVKSDYEGKFIINEIAQGKYVLLVTASGFFPKNENVTVSAEKTSTVNIILKSDTKILDEVYISGYRVNHYHNDSSFIVSKLPLKDLENPQVYNSISKELLTDQVVTEFNDAIKNATGITRLWESTGRGGDGAEFYSMRGFSVQPTMMNGMPSANNGVIDPANVESIEVIKGPSGTLFGSPMISYGGLINVTTKKPYNRFGGSFGFIAGNFGLNRITADINTPLNSKASVRLNAAFNDQKSFMDAGFKQSIFIAPSFKLKASERLTFLINTEFLSSEAANAPMIFLNRYVPVAFDKIDLFEKNYTRSFTSNDLTIKNPSFSIQAQALYKLSKSWTSQTVVSRSSTRSSGYYHYLWDLGDGDSFYRYISNRNGETQTTDLQQNFIGDFKIGKIRNRLVFGVDFFQSNILNSSTGWVGNGIVTLSDGNDTGYLTQIAVDSLLVNSFEGVSTAQSQVMSAYFSDVVNILPSLSAMVSVRVDNFSGRTNYWTADELESQVAISPKFGIVYQPVKDRVSFFANYMNGFMNTAPQQVADADGTNVRLETFKPEQANQYELGVKTNLFKNKLALTGSYYNILVSNKLMSDPNNINGMIQGGEVLSQGIEFSLIANPIKGLNIVAGYSNNDSEVIKDNESNGYLGLRPEEAGPAQLINFWASYTLPSTKLKGLGIGIGGNAASEHIALNRNVTGSFTLPAYQVFNASLSYRASNYAVIFKVDNLMNQKYYSGWSGVIAQQLRSYSISLNYNF